MMGCKVKLDKDKASIRNHESYVPGTKPIKRVLNVHFKA